MEGTYVLPIRRVAADGAAELAQYLAEIARSMQIVIVDGSDPAVFRAHHLAWKDVALHVPPAPELVTPMGKVGGVLSGLRHAAHDRVVIADDDVRYDPDTLRRLLAMLAEYDVVRPQNYFRPLPWHARWDTARSLLNRVSGGDWPGTLAVRRSRLEATGGYSGDVMFENLELVRTVVAAGGREKVAYDVYVRRLPPSSRQFLSQRVRQAYDELARPMRLLVWLSVLPLVALLAISGTWPAVVLLAVAAVAAAEAGRRRAGGRRYFPWTSSLLAPLWIAERAVCIWPAVGARLLLGGIPYRDSRLRRAATPLAELRRRYGSPA